MQRRYARESSAEDGEEIVGSCWRGGGEEGVSEVILQV